MKKLRNIAIYYIVLGLLCGTVFWWWLFGLWRLAVVGVVLGALYLFLRFVWGLKTNTDEQPKNKLIIWDILFYAHPILLIALVLWYVEKPFNQTIVLPKEYEGVVVIDYDRESGQPKERINTFLGLGGSRLIKVNKKGYAKTQFKVEDIFVPTFGSHSGATLKGLQIFYENDLENEIPFFSRERFSDDADELFKKIIKHNLLVSFNYYYNDKHTVFVVGKGKAYNKYFVTTKPIKTTFDYSFEADSLKMEYQKQIENLEIENLEKQ